MGNKNTDSSGQGLFIAFEGGEGSGKTTQTKLLAAALEEREIDYCLTRQPGGTRLGANLRALLLDRGSEPLSSKAEALLFAADRAEHVEKVIQPALTEGKVVICDRYIASTMAYQGYANGLDRKTLRTISNWASSDLDPGVTFFLDLDPVVGLERAMRVLMTRFEDKDVSYHEKVRRGFLAQKNESWVTVDAMESIEVIHGKILHYVLGVLDVMNQWKDAQDRLRSARSFSTKIYQYRCPECDFYLREKPDEPSHFYCENGHGEIFVPPLGDTREGFVTFAKDVMPGKVVGEVPC